MVVLVAVAPKAQVLEATEIHLQPPLHKVTAGVVDKGPQEALRILVAVVVVPGVWVVLGEEHQVIMVEQVEQVELV
jgi:hypothetical protein